MRIGIVGAGVSGLGAAREAKKSGHDVVVFESAAEVGGRCTTVSFDGFVFDAGATSIAPRKRLLESMMLTELDTSDLIKLDKPIHVHQSLRITSGDPMKGAVERYTYRQGNRRLPELLAEGLDVRCNRTIDSIEKNGNGSYRLGGEEVDSIILSAPVPQSQHLLASVGEFRPVQNVRYRNCISVLLGFDSPTPETKYHAIIEPEQRHPLTWLSLESAKCPGRAPEGKCAMVAQMSPEFSRMNWEGPDDAIVHATCHYVHLLYGEQFENPLTSKVVRFPYSQPEMTAMQDNVNRAGSKIVLAGDGLIGGRVEFAYESGVLAARMLGGSA